MAQNKSRFQFVLFGVYCSVMAYLLFARPMYHAALPYWEKVQRNLNLIPFHSIRRFLRLLGLSSRPDLMLHAAVNLFGNVILFLPLGYLLPKIWTAQRKLWIVLLTTAAAITLVELTQLLTLVGSCDIDDLILNVLGAALGYGLFRLAHNRKKPAS